MCPPDVTSYDLPSVSAGTLLAAPGGGTVAASSACVIDLRAPVEFAQDHVPGAHNVPLFDGLDREVIGTIYHRVSADAAFEEGRERLRPRVAELVSEIARRCGWAVPAGDGRAQLEQWTAQGRAPFEQGLQSKQLAELPAGAVVLHCWRGGLRSKSVVALVRALGLENACLLEGGYRAYRRQILEDLAQFSAPPAFVLRGWTGVGKTLVLRALERLEPDWVVDLEHLAGHRSSILGMVGLQPRTQRGFDSHLAARLRRGFSECVVFEGESRKVGDVIIPESVWRGLHGGVNIELVAPTARRVDVLCEDYLASEESRAQLRGQLPFIEQRLGPRKFDGVLVDLLDAGRERELVEILLERYYDPLYGHSERGRDYAVRIDTSDPERAARAVRDWIRAHPEAAGRRGAASRG